MATNSGTESTSSDMIDMNSQKTQQLHSMSIVEIKGHGKSPAAANPLIARGAFGRVDIALIVRRQHTSSQQSPSSNIHSVSLAAIKTIPNATIRSGNTSQIDEAKLTREAFAELNSLRLLNGHENVTPLLGFYGATDSEGGDGFGGWDWGGGGQNAAPTSLCLVFPYHPIDLYEALVYRRFNPSSKLASFTDVKSIVSSDSSYFLPKLVVQSVMYDVLSGLHHLHSHCILHRDIKPGNCYITREGRIQLGDFGLAKIVPPMLDETKSHTAETNGPMSLENVNLTNGMCTLQYRPPEVLLGGTGIIKQSRNGKSSVNGAFDIFSAGCIFVELLTLSGPIFPGRSVLDQLGRIFRILGTPTEDNWPQVKFLPDWNKVSFDKTDGTGIRERIGRLDSEDEVDLLSKMLVLDPLQRYSAQECLEHKLFQTFERHCASHGQAICTSLLPPDTQVMDPLELPTNIDGERTEREEDLLDSAKHYAAKNAASRRNFVAGLGKADSFQKERWAFGRNAAG